MSDESGRQHPVTRYPHITKLSAVGTRRVCPNESADRTRHSQAVYRIREPVERSLDEGLWPQDTSLPGDTSRADLTIHRSGPRRIVPELADLWTTDHRPLLMSNLPKLNEHLSAYSLIHEPSEAAHPGHLIRTLVKDPGRLTGR